MIVCFPPLYLQRSTRQIHPANDSHSTSASLQGALTSSCENYYGGELMGLLGTIIVQPPDRSSGLEGYHHLHLRSMRPSNTPATTRAHAPVPHASVAPAPRSHTLIFTWDRLSTLKQSGKT